MFSVMRLGRAAAVTAVALVAILHQGETAHAQGADWIERTIAAQAKAATVVPGKPRPRPIVTGSIPTQQPSVAVASAEAERDSSTCRERFTQRPLFECVSEAFDKLAGRIETGPAALLVSPKVVVAIRVAAIDLKAAADTNSAVSAVQKVKATIAAELTSVSAAGPAPARRTMDSEKASLVALVSVPAKAEAAIQN